MGTYTPFTYHLYHVPTKQHYYGVRYAKGCHPSNLWTTYFSSSKRVKALVNEYGADSFISTVRKTFKCAKSALAWEAKVLRRMKVTQREDWLNVWLYGSALVWTDELKAKASIRIAQRNLNQVWTKEMRAKRSALNQELWRDCEDLMLASRVKAPMPVFDGHTTFRSKGACSKHYDRSIAWVERRIIDGTFSHPV